MDIILPQFTLSHFRLTLMPREAVRLPRMNKGITLRGAFGTAFRSLVCVDRQASCDTCPVHPTCPYGFIFSPRVPQGAERLRLNRDIPRPFVIKPPLDRREVYDSGEPLHFDLVMVGRARDFLPYFLVSFRELGERGIGAGRGRFDTEKVEVLDAHGSSQTVYQGGDSQVRVPDSVIRPEDFLDAGNTPSPETIRIRFLTPVLIKEGGRWVRPTFGPLLRRLRDRINALAYFYCGEAIRMDFSAFGESAERIRCRDQKLRWFEENRYSRHRDLKHTLKGFLGSVTFEGDLRPFLPFLQVGAYVHVGKAVVFGQGWYGLEHFSE